VPDIIPETVITPTWGPAAKRLCFLAYTARIGDNLNAKGSNDAIGYARFLYQSYLFQVSRPPTFADVEVSATARMKMVGRFAIGHLGQWKKLQKEVAVPRCRLTNYRRETQRSFHDRSWRGQSCDLGEQPSVPVPPSSLDSLLFQGGGASYRIPGTTWFHLLHLLHIHNFFNDALCFFSLFSFVD
jgi:hypothetical protein